MPRTRQSAKRRSLTPEEAGALLDAAGGERLEALIVIGLSAGLRPGELTGPLWSVNFDGQPKTLTVSGAMKRGPDGRVNRGGQAFEGRPAHHRPPADRR